MDQLPLWGCVGCTSPTPGTVSSRFCDDCLRHILEGCTSGNVETWAEHPNYKGYWVSSFGQVRDPEGKLLPPNDNGRGYLRVEMPDRKRRVHQLCLEVFIGPRPPGLEGCHWDDRPRNNMLDNLYWGSSKDNKADALRNNTAWYAKNLARCGAEGCDELVRGHRLCPAHYREWRQEVAQRAMALSVPLA